MSESPTISVAQRLLARREHSAWQLRQKLQQRDHNSAEIDVTLALLEANGQQSDARFAEALVYAKYQRGIGPKRIQYELSQAGVTQEIITTALAAYSATAWQELAANVCNKRYGASNKNLNITERSRRSRFLQQRGFTGEQIQYAMSFK